jgi:hypothetical protein
VSRDGERAVVWLADDAAPAGTAKWEWNPSVSIPQIGLHKTRKKPALVKPLTQGLD